MTDAGCLELPEIDSSAERTPSPGASRLGPDTALIIGNTLAASRRGGLMTAAGVCAGQACWTIATAAGLAALLAASRPAFLVIRTLGACYLIYLGLRALHTAVATGSEEAGPQTPQTTLSPTAALRQGLLSNLSNPKMAGFFIGLLPGLSDPGHGSFTVMLTRGLLFSGMTFLWLASVATAASRIGAILRQQRARRLLSGATGLTLIGLGIHIATG
ncbi:MAG: LysE family translocator [Streptosporangiaceae bacterium]